MKRIVIADLLAAARQSTGLEDFGAPALSPALDKLVDSLHQEARLTDVGIEARIQRMVSLLINRLKLMDILKRRPDIANAELGTPIFVIGLPRSGTTKMQRIIAADSRFNHTAMWETLFPVPLSDSADDRATRIGYCQAFCDALNKLPDMEAVHTFGPLVPEEDVILLQHGFMVEAIDPELRAPTYMRWLRTADRRGSYQQEANFLRVLADAHGKTGDPWILKGTYHGTQLDVILDVMPNAKFIYCHRDPLDNIPSYCSLLNRMRRLLSDEVDKIELGREILEYWSGHLHDMIEVRKRIPADRIFDLPYGDIVWRMPEALEKIYAFAGIPLTDEARAAHRRWEADNAINKHGRHEYDLRDYGLTEKQIAEACSEYRAMFIADQR